ncbi:MAG TPA: hypothetical protein VJQ78_15845 [Sphingobium sp.]|nr:hypothetical protein [Sphingobium sp.]
MIRTLIFGAIAGYVGKKLYDEGKLTEFKDDLVARYNQARSDLSARSGRGSGSSTGAGSASSGLGTSGAGSSTPSMAHGSSSTTHSAAPSIS